MGGKYIDEAIEIIDDYRHIDEFIEQYNNITAIEFDYYVVNRANLFVTKEDFDFNALNQVMARINDALPAIKRIFVKPIIHLKDEDDIQPVEEVKRINSHTLNHIAIHSELWDDVTEKGIKPLKLFTRTYTDNYSIYENILFAKTVDTALAYIRKNIRILEKLMYFSKILEFNLLERVEHLKYFLAIGKLHTGYIRNFSQLYDVTAKHLEKLRFTQDTLTARLKRDVYRLNKNYCGNFKIHSSNILKMQKDYHKVYLLLKYFNRIKEIPAESTPQLFNDFDGSYKNFLKLLAIFAAMHLDFVADEKLKIDFRKLNADFNFKRWKLNLSTTDDQSLVISVARDVRYTVCVAPVYSKDGEQGGYDEVVRVTPFDDDKHLSVSILDIDSFRRLQQIILRAMVYSCKTFDECPFCEGTLSPADKSGNAYRCKNCNTVIEKHICAVNGKEYFSTSIHGYKVKEEMGEGMLHYRNVTKLTPNNKVVCPHCGRVHFN